MLQHCCITIACLSAAAALQAADEKPHSHPAASTEGSAAAIQLEQLKSLVGDWKSTTPDEHAVDGIVLRYRVIGGGSAVMETIYPGSDHEMISIYHLDGDALRMTHYCILGNQPQMIAKQPSKDSAVIELKFSGGTNFGPETDMHVHDARMEIADEDHLRNSWSFLDGGRKTATKLMNAVRVAGNTGS